MQGNAEGSASHSSSPGYGDGNGTGHGDGQPQERLAGETTSAPVWRYNMDNDEDEVDEDEDVDYDEQAFLDEYEEYDEMFQGEDGALYVVVSESEMEEEYEVENEDEEETPTNPDRPAEGTRNEEDNEGSEGILNMLRTGARTGLLNRGQLLALMRNPNLTSVLFQDDPESEAEFLQWTMQNRREPKDPNRFPKVPSDEGARLMRSGVFGTDDYEYRGQTKHFSLRMLERELGLGDREVRRRNVDLVRQSMIPCSRADQIIHFNDPVYSGQFSDDGNFFYACGQDFKVRMYDTSNPYNWVHYKTVLYPWGQWTITDATLSPDNKWLAYTSIASTVCIAPTDPNDSGDPYALELNSGLGGGHSIFGIWSVRFSGDGRELVVGTSSSSIIVYDIESRTVVHRIRGHRDDVNAVCFADKESPHILYSGSDDTTLKVWDRRSMGDSREAGAFVGHREGLTYIDSKGDGRYILSNGKDQSMKLWDLRMAMSTDRFNSLDRVSQSRFDYRGGTYDEEDWDPHPHDNSLVTFRGHKVLRTLIRCHFSPPGSTNSRYVYSGSTDGKVYIWNIDATLAATIDVKRATMGTRPLDHRSRFYHLDEPGGWGTCVRDASWHPSAPVLVASAWNGYNMARGTCTVHSFNQGMDDEGDPPMGRSVNEFIKEDPELLPSRYPAP